MHWSIPAKTFLVGEYAALAGQPAIILTTTPCFELTQVKEPGLHGIHPNSPAGRWWARAPDKKIGLQWYDPYQGLGGMGASSAQFISVYQALATAQGLTVDNEQLFAAYQDLTTDPSGIPPSGYDVLAQCAQGCVYLNRQTKTHHSYPWPFTDLGFILIHTKQKLATHQHLQSLQLTASLDAFRSIIACAKTAFDTQDSQRLVHAVQAYHQALYANGWVAPHSLKLIQQLQKESQALAIKGCGAMGADVLLLLIEKDNLQRQIQYLSAAGWMIMATSHDCCTHST